MEASESKRDASFIDNLLKTEKTSESLVSRGYCIVRLPTTTSFIYSSFYAFSQSFFNASDTCKQNYAQIQFNEKEKSPNSLHGYSLVANTKQQFMIRYINSCASPALKQLKTPNHAFIHEDDTGTGMRDGDFGVLGMLLFEKLDTLSRDIMKDVLNLYNKPERIVSDLLDPIHVINGSITREKDHCFGEYTLNGYVSSSVLDCYHYFGTKGYGHNSHRDSGLLTIIPVTNDNPSLQVLDQRENEWINIERLIHDYCDRNDNGTHKYDYAVALLGESVHPYVNRHISNVNNILKPCFYRIDNGEKERYSVVYKQRTAPLRSHARYQEDYVLAKLHSAIDMESVHSRLMNKATDTSNDYKNYKYYEYNAYDKTKWTVIVGSLVVFGLFLIKRQGLVDVKVTFHW